MKSLSNKVAYRKVCNVIEKRLQHRCEYWKIFKNIYFEDDLQTAASASWSILYL